MKAKIPTSFGESIISENLFLDIVIVISENEFHVNLNEFNLEEFDIILGMNWLNKYKAKIHYAKHGLTFRESEGNKISYQEMKPKPIKTKFISALTLQI